MENRGALQILTEQGSEESLRVLLILIFFFFLAVKIQFLSEPRGQRFHITMTAENQENNTKMNLNINRQEGKMSLLSSFL
ncbi:hypothetical protein GDO78_007109 [Eleutherodactylus coqui]|uniref:Uncharacterized protein n=1 Tax=Eleutherodactylus coqui TaxID=57060 RepID=A0A8J6KFH9_ELECQ|nr:hypothetical protein GDO78_007109 [Eleutherodactylus coqui]